MEVPIIVKQELNASAKEVWEAITAIDKMRQWYFENIPDFKPEVGFETSFLIENEGRKFTHQWKITEVEPLKNITYEWRFKEYPSILGVVTFSISEKENKTLLKVTNQGIETWPNNVPEFTRESCQGGWEYFINQNLKNYINEL
ncbi:SRPBCC domain-containing protein [Aureisphaera sp. CAU 1614]|uniref:SRPBCC domain-containing protein n=1 Tax=Halomarinibacterium sedimenti TaxID=2857106 RepID=A0A9X1JZ50_9FLAO|nr:SRPBCC domain-containing protein [Halomarinibacterium sedimenti]MBW2938192.1 SRPBCC domain-containing protein [Halomarinibacterium sedimenti]